MHDRVTQGLSFLVLAGLRETVHGEEVGYLFLGVLDDPGPNDVVLWHHEVDGVFLRELVVHLVFLLLLFVKFEDCCGVLFLHFPNKTLDLDSALFWELVFIHKLFHGLIWRLVSVLNFCQLL